MSTIPAARVHRVVGPTARHERRLKRRPIETVTRDPRPLWSSIRTKLSTGLGLIAAVITAYLIYEVFLITSLRLSAGLFSS